MCNFRNTAVQFRIDILINKNTEKVNSKKLQKYSGLDNRFFNAQNYHIF